MTSLSRDLTPEEQKASEEFVLRNIGIAKTLARRYLIQGVDIEDLNQEALAGLVQAARTYNPARGIESKWAWMHCRRALLRSVDRLRDGIVLPEAVGLLRVKVRRAETGYEAKHGKTPSLETLAEMLEVSEAMVHLAKTAPTSSTILQDSGDGENGDTSHLSRLKDHGAQDALDRVVNRAAMADELAVIAQLPEDERTVITLRYGLGGEEPLTTRATVTRTGWSEYTVWLLEARGLARLRHPALGMRSPL